MATDRAFFRGMATLSVAFPYPATSEKQADARAELYQQQLGNLSDEQWSAVVSRVISERLETTFPPVGVLQAYAYAVRLESQPESAPMLPEDERRRLAKDGLRQIKDAFAKAPRPQLPPAPTHASGAISQALTYRGGIETDLEWDERRASLKEQAAAILAEEAAAKEDVH